jgi:hypothetical protein
MPIARPFYFHIDYHRNASEISGRKTAMNFAISDHALVFGSNNRRNFRFISFCRLRIIILAEAEWREFRGFLFPFFLPYLRGTFVRYLTLLLRKME